MMREGRKDAMFPRLYGDLQIRVWVEKHPFLQPHGLEIYKTNVILFKYVLLTLHMCRYTSSSKHDVGFK